MEPPDLPGTAALACGALARPENPWSAQHGRNDDRDLERAQERAAGTPTIVLVDLYCVPCLSTEEAVVQAATVRNGNALCIRHLAKDLAADPEPAMPEDQWLDELQRNMRRTPQRDAMHNELRVV